MTQWWLLDGENRPLPCRVGSYAAWRELIGVRFRTAHTRLDGGVVVSTVFLGYSPAGTGRMWETAVLGGPLDGRTWRWRSHGQACQRHREVVALARLRAR